jgi:hypothetical protein
MKNIKPPFPLNASVLKTVLIFTASLFQGDFLAFRLPNILSFAGGYTFSMLATPDVRH